MRVSTSLSVGWSDKGDVISERCGLGEEHLELEIRMVDIDHVNALCAYLRRRVRFVLGRFSRSVGRVTVRVANGTPEDVGTGVRIIVALFSGWTNRSEKNGQLS